jgi:hypothetical protein
VAVGALETVEPESSLTAVKEDFAMRIGLAQGAITLSFSLLAWMNAGAVHAQQRSLEELLREAHFVFVGDVVKLGSSNMASVTPSANTAVVRVSDVLTLESIFSGFRGREITVELLQPQRLERTLFFTNITGYGTSLDAVEVAHQPAERSGDALRGDIRAAEAANTDRAIMQRIARASIVASGVVTDVSDIKRGMPKSEHDPLWAIATVKVDTYLKGEGPATLQVLFPTSTDELWLESPKFKPGQTGVWILQRDQKEKGFPKLRLPGLTALDPLDYHPAAALPHLRELVARQK